MNTGRVSHLYDISCDLMSLQDEGEGEEEKGGGGRRRAHLEDTVNTDTVSHLYDISCDLSEFRLF